MDAGRAIVPLVAALLLAACSPPVRHAGGWAVPRPAPARVVDEPLPAGPESMYDLVNIGTLADADALLDNRWPVPRFPAAKLADPPLWTEDPFGDKYWRFIFYSLRPTSNLLWAYYHTGEVRYRDKLLAILRSYTARDATDPTADPAKMNDAHAIAFRAMVLVNTYRKLERSGDLPADLVAPLERSIARVGYQLTTPQYFQPAHNHGFTQAAALLLVTTAFPQVDPGRAWHALALLRLGDLMEHTVDPDGVQTEKSPFYHFYVLKFALQLLDWAGRTGAELPAGFAGRVAAMVRYATYVLWPDGSVPVLGSSVRFRPDGAVALLAPLMKRYPEFAFAVTAGAQGTPPAERAVRFGHSGIVVLRAPVAPYRDSSQVLMDAGAPTTTHAHFEPLAVNFYAGGRAVLVDSGLDTYAPGTTFGYFHGVAGHNTVQVDGRDQDGGPVGAGLTEARDGWAYQSGTASVYSGVTHRRAVLLLAPGVLLVADALQSAQAHRYEQLWHLLPGGHVTADGLTTHLYDARDRSTLDISQEAGGQAMALRTTTAARTRSRAGTRRSTARRCRTTPPGTPSTAPRPVS